MNERIKQLAKQSEEYAIAEYEKWTPTEDFSGVPHIRNIFNEKFAELIVRDCAKAAGDFEYARLHDSLVEDHVLKHFGVEE
jgi:hypothetical protein